MLGFLHRDRSARRCSRSHRGIAPKSRGALPEMKRWEARKVRAGSMSAGDFSRRPHCLKKTAETPADEQIRRPQK
jgi:hypothetical protein